jgi:methionine sulfoxide reductase catalytic subunit
MLPARRDRMTESAHPMPKNPQSPSPELLRASLTDADDRIRLSHWMQPQQGIAPRTRIGQRWFNTLWALPIGAAALLCLIALAQSLRELPGVETFIREDPGIAQAAPSVDSGFPWWLQLRHFLNMFFMLFIMRAGLQILADHPRLYWGRDCTPGNDWFRSRSLSRKGESGPRRMIPSRCQHGSASPACGTRSAWRAGGTSRSTSCG